MIRLIGVTPDNWRTELAVNKDQERFVANRTVLLARAYAYRDLGSRAFIICSDDTPVGMALYYTDPEYGEYEFSQFFIDRRYQGRGFGYEAAKRILDLMREDGRFDRVSLCYIDGDEAARKLYEKLGFRHTGEVEDDEVMMELMLR
ncbi:MAG: GNAT family N-acetyltransferase [Clostridia bacterium]|nr:GNAT family N-acetyltransferase [Clostridia bacterium]